MNKLTITTVVLALATSLAAGSALARGPWAINKGNTWGWQLMTAEEGEQPRALEGLSKVTEQCVACHMGYRVN